MGKSVARGRVCELDGSAEPFQSAEDVIFVHLMAAGVLFLADDEALAVEFDIFA